MAAAHVASQGAGVTMPSGSGSSQITVNAGAATDLKKVSVAMAAFRNAAVHSPNAMLLNAISMTPLGASVVFNGALVRGWILPTGSAHLASVPLELQTSGGAGTIGATMGIQTYSGIDQASPFDGYTTTGAASGDTATINVSSEPGDIAVMMSCMRSQTMTPISGTERFDNLDPSGNTGFGMDIDGAASVTLSAQNGFGFSNGWSAFGLNLNAAPPEVAAPIITSPTAAETIAPDHLVTWTEG